MDGSVISFLGYLVSCQDLVQAARVAVYLFTLRYRPHGAAAHATDTVGRSLESVQQDTSALFYEMLKGQEGYMQGYDKVVISPAPQITDWNNIIAVYSVRAQHEGMVAIEMTDDAVELL